MRPESPKATALTEEILRREYLDEGLSGIEIARKHGVSQDIVYRRLVKFGIPRRPWKPLASVSLPNGVKVLCPKGVEPYLSVLSDRSPNPALARDFGVSRERVRQWREVVLGVLVGTPYRLVKCYGEEGYRLVCISRNGDPE